MSWDDLPPGVQRKILSFVPMSARLRTCSLVSSTMYEAAAAATQQLHLELYKRAGRIENLEKWLVRHGQHVTSLQLANGTVRLQSPCPHLQQLHLHGCVVLLDPGSTCAHSTSLTKLVLEDCSFKVNVHKLAGALTAMSHLQHLALISLTDNDEESWARAGRNLPSELLQHLTQLTHLSLFGSEPYSCTTAPTLQHISTLQHLQELCLQGLDNPTLGLSLSPSTTPGISCLTALTRLELSIVVLDVAVLQPLSQLRKLLLRFIDLAPVRSMSPLHVPISQLVLLQDLQLLGQLSFAPAEAFAGLTASSTLQNLEMTLPLREHGRHGLWQHVFPAGRTLLHCTSVSLSASSSDSGLGSSDITSLVSCCPLLRRVGLSLQPDAGLMPLTQLTALTELRLHSSGRGCIQMVAALTGLRRLTLWDSSGTALRDCLPLTRLQQLTLLRLEVAATSGTRMSLYWSSAGEPGQAPGLAAAADSNCQPGSSDSRNS